MHTTEHTAPVTVDELARMINKGFKETANNLNEFKEEVRTEFKQVDTEFKKIHVELKEIKHVLKKHDNEFNNHEHRLCKIETELQIA